MARRKKLKTLIAILKDKASFIKATLSTDRTSSSINMAVLRATTSSSTSPPPEHRITTILSFGHGTRPTASTCIVAIMDRLHHSHSAYVALKSLMILHNIITRGSFILRDQLSFYPSSGGLNFLNLSRFTDKTDVQARVFSSWVRWYAGFLECNLMTSRVLGIYFSSSSSSTKLDTDKNKENVTILLNSDLLKEIEALVEMIEEICKVPESLDIQRNELVHEVIRLVSEDYRSAQYHIMIRLTELDERLMVSLSPSDSDELTCVLKRVEGCKERLTELFQNRKRNDEFWELEGVVMEKLVRVKKEREMELVNWRRIEQKKESTQWMKRVEGASQCLRLLPYENGESSKWLNVDRVQLTVSTASA